MNLKDLINEEQLLDICLSLLSLGDDSDFDGAAGMIVTARAIQELSKDEEFTEEEVANKVNELIISKSLEILVKKGEAEVDLTGKEVKYRIVGR